MNDSLADSLTHSLPHFFNNESNSILVSRFFSLIKVELISFDYFFFILIDETCLPMLSNILLFTLQTNFYVKGTAHLQNTILKYVMLRTVSKHSTIIITVYTWYHRCREIIQITGGAPLRLHWNPDSKAGRRTLKFSDAIWTLSRLTRIMVDLER